MFLKEMSSEKTKPFKCSKQRVWNKAEGKSVLKTYLVCSLFSNVGVTYFTKQARHHPTLTPQNLYTHILDVYLSLSQVQTTNSKPNKKHENEEIPIVATNLRQNKKR